MERPEADVHAVQGWREERARGEGVRVERVQGGVQRHGGDGRVGEETMRVTRAPARERFGYYFIS
eukprot:31565-Pelagococcus_subviridis.AAC.9